VTEETTNKRLVYLQLQMSENFGAVGSVEAGSVQVTSLHSFMQEEKKEEDHGGRSSSLEVDT
jgi:hypothetical protein